MDLTHVILIALLLIGIAMPIIGYVMLARILRKDEAIDAATFLALHELRERFERTK